LREKDDKVQEIKERQPKYIEFKEKFEKLSYLGAIKNETLWNFFSDTIPLIVLPKIFTLDDQSI